MAEEAINTDPTFEEITKWCTAQAAYHDGSRTVDAVIGITRGGLIPGVLMSHLLKVPFITMDVKCLDSAGDNNNQHFTQVPVLPSHYKSILIVDDIIDKGAVFNRVLKILGAVYPDVFRYTFVLYHKFGVGVYGSHNHNFTQTIPWDSPFINFPWELK